jgi:hypothetical protein
MSMLLLLGAAPGVTRLNKAAPAAQRVRGTEGYGAARGALGASIDRSRYRGRFLLAGSRSHRQHAPPVGVWRTQGQAR